MDVRDNPGNCPQTLTSCSRSLLLLDRWCLGGSHRDQFWELLKSINFLQMNLFSSTQSDYDLQVTGILAKQLDLDHKELNSYWTMNSSRLMATKLQQSPLTYHKDFVAGPTGRYGKYWWQKWLTPIVKELSCLQDYAQEGSLVLSEQVQEQHFHRQERVAKHIVMFRSGYLAGYTIEDVPKESSW